MIIWYTNNIMVENRDRKLDLTISICNTTKQRDSIRSIDTDLDCIMVDFQNGFEDVIENLINAKVYSSKKSLEDDIKDGNLQLHAKAQYIDISKCIPWYSRTSAQKSFRSHKEYYENCASAITYCIEYPSGIRRRFEVYGDMTWENSWEYRYELSDYDHIHERYKFGDIVKFKHPICGYSEGIITSIAEPKIGTGDIDYMMYSAEKMPSYHVTALKPFIMTILKPSLETTKYLRKEL